MHELHLVRTLLRTAEQAARAHGAPAIGAVRLRLGALCGVSSSSLRRAFEQLAPGTCAAEARLELIVSEDLQDAQAQHVCLERVELRT